MSFTLSRCRYDIFDEETVEMHTLLHNCNAYNMIYFHAQPFQMTAILHSAVQWRLFCVSLTKRFNKKELWFQIFKANCLAIEGAEKQYTSIENVTFFCLIVLRIFHFHIDAFFHFPRFHASNCFNNRFDIHSTANFEWNITHPYTQIKWINAIPHTRC